MVSATLALFLACAIWAVGGQPTRLSEWQALHPVLYEKDFFEQELYIEQIINTQKILNFTMYKSEDYLRLNLPIDVQINIDGNSLQNKYCQPCKKQFKNSSYHNLHWIMKHFNKSQSGLLHLLNEYRVLSYNQDNDYIRDGEYTKLYNIGSVNVTSEELLKLRYETCLQFLSTHSNINSTELSKQRFAVFGRFCQDLLYKTDEVFDVGLLQILKSAFYTVLYYIFILIAIGYYVTLYLSFAGNSNQHNEDEEPEEEVKTKSLDEMIQISESSDYKLI